MNDTKQQWESIEEAQFRGGISANSGNAYSGGVPTNPGSVYSDGISTNSGSAYSDGYIPTLEEEGYYGENPLAREERAHAVLYKSFSFMVMALVLSAVSAVYAAQSNFVYLMIFNRTIFYGLLLAEIAVVAAANFAISRKNVVLSSILFFTYSIVNGITLSVIFLQYSKSAIVSVFVLAAATFAVLAIIGMTTKKNLNSLGTMSIMMLTGVIGAMILNYFVRSDLFDWFIIVIGLLSFIGLTLYDTRKIKEIGYEDTESDTALLGIMGALQLYLDLINIFLYLLRLFGGNSRN